ncbi:MAG TPA: UbiA family prenyltransferase [Candidatus Thermoplasmatota archaeon]|nr:UbiA family prenyltransferase [Candidatus Thermoplasmatota archaeon]
MIRNYLEISRLFNMGLTGVAPVLGALSMFTTHSLTYLQLFVLFVIGCLAHAYGFVLNDIFDVPVDRLSKDLSLRPLVKGSITFRRATIFAFGCLILSFLLSRLFFFTNQSQYLMIALILLIAYLLATVYDALSKKYPGMDLFVASAVFFLILFGAATIGTPTLFAWTVAFIGGLQVLFMNMINGAIKDIDHDKDGSARTLAIWLGAKVHAGVMELPLSFKTTGYLIEIVRTVLVFAPFVLPILQPMLWRPQIWQLALLVLFEALTFVSIYRLFSIKAFNRARIRKGIGMIVIFMYATTPIMLGSLNPYFMLVAFIPPLWFVLSNLTLHKTLFEAKTM